MYISENENIEIYFICYKKKEMNLVESYYDEILNIHYWYFNAYQAYKLWQKNFKGVKLGELSKQLVIVAASKYLIYLVENNKIKNSKEYEKILENLDKIQKELEIIINAENILHEL